MWEKKPDDEEDVGEEEAAGDENVGAVSAGVEAFHGGEVSTADDDGDVSALI